MLHSTLSANRFTPVADTGHKLKISCDADGIYIMSENGLENIFWSRENLKKAFEKKYKWLIWPNMYLVDKPDELEHLISQNEEEPEIECSVMNGLYKKWKPALNKNISEELMKLDRVKVEKSV